IEEFKPDTMLHMAAILSATCEKNPQVAWDINMGGLVNALEASRIYNLKFFTPSSIGAFGPSTPKDNTPQTTIQRPNTMYGINKVSGELLCDYYLDRKSTRLNSSHVSISYAVFCLKKKKQLAKHPRLHQPDHS